MDIFIPWLLDVLLSLIFLLVVVIGTNRGFVRSIWGTITLGGAFVIAYLFGPSVGGFICDNFVLKYVTDYAYAEISSISVSESGQYNIGVIFEKLPQEFVELVSNCGANLDALEQQFIDATTISQEEMISLATDIAMPISKTISQAIAIVLVFLVALLVLWLLGLVVKVIVKIPIIRTLDKFLGFFLSVINGVVIVWVISIVLGIFVEKGFMQGESAEALNNITSASYIFNFFCDLSPIDFINIK